MVAAVVALAAGAHPASAAEPDSQGWWWSSGAVGGAGAGTPPALPDVPADGLYIQSSVEGSTPGAYAALVYRLPAGSAITGPLTLTVAAGSATTPGAALMACPLVSVTIRPDQGAPAYDCHTSARATLAPGESSFSIPVAALASRGALAVALLPAATAERVVLDRPGPVSLAVSQSPG